MVTRLPTSDEIEQFWESFQTGFMPPPTFTLFKGEFLKLDIEAKTLRCGFTATDGMLNPARTVQGGILAAFMDDTMGPLVVNLMAGRAFPSTADLHAQYHRPAKPGRFECEAKVTRLGKTICTTSAELYNDKGQLVASAIQTAVLVAFSRGE